ncbi:MAG TPA: helix-turn-helix transcriptional regulator [Candidatus Tumulicola sp.]|nr:helix-turn-helix transcriptional regulator [Candidatus Tumulicola sp.]
MRKVPRTVGTNERDRESLRARIRVAVDLAIGNSHVQAHHALESVAPAAQSSGDEILALYFQARAIANIKARRLDEGFAAFDLALQTARRYGEAALCARILINYGTAAVQDGDVSLAIALLDEALTASRKIERTTARNTLEKVRSLASTKPVALVSLSEALYAAGQLERAAAVLHEFHTMRSGNTTDLITAASVGIPLGMLLADRALLRLSRDPNLIELAFSRREQWLCGPLAEAFCTYYESVGRRGEHDALLARALDSLTSLDNSLALGLRIARLGDAASLPRVSALALRQCTGNSPLLDAYRDLFESFVGARRQTGERARELARRAERRFARAGRPTMRALALHAAGDSDAATALLRTCGAAQPASPRWLGAPVQRRLAAQLTPRESEVARLAARGMTNRTIADALHLSERTVHHHCEAIFGKLGIRSRWQISNALADVAQAAG